MNAWWMFFGVICAAVLAPWGLLELSAWIDRRHTARLARDQWLRDVLDEQAALNLAIAEALHDLNDPGALENWLNEGWKP